MLSPRGQSGLEAKILASASASNIWPRPGLGLQQKNQQPRRDRRTNLFTLYFADYRTSHYDRRYLLCDREWEIKLCRFDHNDINSPVCCQSSFDTFLFITLSLASAWPRRQETGLGLGLDLKALASVSASASGPWPRARSRPRDFGLV